MLHRSGVLLASALLFQQGQGLPSHPIAVSSRPQDSIPVPNDLQAVSIEFAFFTDYAGNKSNPNSFSKNLLENFEEITGVHPKVRVGGTSQDHSNYFPDQKQSIKRIYDDPSDDQPSQINYGPGFFESYHTLGSVEYIHGLNLAQNHSIERLTRAATAACSSIGSQLNLLELGNEWDMEPERYRPAGYSAQDYVDEWNRKSAAVKDAVEQACPDIDLGFMAPTFIFLPGIVDPAYNAEDIYNLGYDPKNLTRELCFHNYMGVNSPPNPPPAYDLQTNLMNHTSIVNNLAGQIERRKKLEHLGHPFILGELNSIAGEGVTGETNVFGDALWLVDFSLWAGQHGIQRLHFHQGTDYRYASWQPIKTEAMPIMTRPPYYGQIMVASALGRSEYSQVVNLPLSEDTNSAYAIYNEDELSKLVVLNMQAFNQTSGESSRPTREYKFQIPGNARRAKVERLIAPGSDSTEHVTFGGVSYDYDLKEGKPVVVDPEMEMARIRNGVLSIELPDSSAALVTFV